MNTSQPRESLKVYLVVIIYNLIMKQNLQLSEFIPLPFTIETRDYMFIKYYIFLFAYGLACSYTYIATNQLADKANFSV